MSEESIENISKSDSLFVPTFTFILPDVHFSGHYLINNNVCIPKKVTHPYISYILNPRLRGLNTDFMLDDCFYVYVELTKNAYPDK